MKVRDVMTADPNCCLTSDNARAAAQIMLKDDVGAVPVVRNGETRELVGIVTDRDLCLSVIAAGKSPDSVKVETCMSSRPVCCRADEDMHRVSELMKQHQVRRIPVVDDRKCVIGIVATADMAREQKVDRAETGEVIEHISQPG